MKKNILKKCIPVMKKVIILVEIPIELIKLDLIEKDDDFNDQRYA